MISSNSNEVAGIYPHTATTLSVPVQIRFVSLEKIIFSKSHLLALFGMGSKKGQKSRRIDPGQEENIDFWNYQSGLVYSKKKKIENTGHSMIALEGASPAEY